MFATIFFQPIVEGLVHTIFVWRNDKIAFKIVVRGNMYIGHCTLLYLLLLVRGTTVSLFPMYTCNM